MTTHAVPHTHGARARGITAEASTHGLWLAGGLVLAFLIPFVLADTLELNRDLYYALYGFAVLAFVASWARRTDQPLLRLTRHRLGLTLALTAAASAVLVLMVYRTEDATSRPDGIEFVGALLWRGVFYGAIDGILLSAFPILAVFAAFSGTKLRRRAAGTALVTLAALVASLAMTAVYHVGYSDFRGEKLRKPLTGDLVWSAPTLLTVNPIGAPLAHVALHTAAVTRSYDTETFLPPHRAR